MVDVDSKFSSQMINDDKHPGDELARKNLGRGRGDLNVHHWCIFGKYVIK